MIFHEFETHIALGILLIIVVLMISNMVKGGR
jgi:hypothetical protein